jgi:DNA-binding NtrC family response regulator
VSDDKPRVLVVDDGRTYAQMVDEQLPEVTLVLPEGEDGPPCVEDGPAAIEYLDAHGRDVDLVLLDMQFDVDEDRLLPLAEDASPKRTRRFQGVAILRELRRRHPHLPIVLMTSVADLSLIDMDAELAAQSMTYILDGDDLDTLRIRINAALRESAQTVADDLLLWGRDRAMQAVRRRLDVLAHGTMPLILEGETGTGKSFIAEHFLHARSGRRGPFVTLDLAAIPADLIPAHLFGALRGSYTGAVADRKGAFELADQGTLFIDEVHNAPLEVQKQLLVVLQDRRVRPLGSAKEIDVDVKVIAATNQPLAEAVAAGKFRQDLYMRLGPATRITIPPLRARDEDLSFFAHRLIERAAVHPENVGLRREVASAVGLAEDADLRLVLGRPGKEDAGDELQLVMPDPVWKRMRRHGWPGNMRELSMVMHNIVSFTLVAALDAVRSGLAMSSPRLQIDPGLVGELLAGSEALAAPETRGHSSEGAIPVEVTAADTLNNVANEVERQYMRALFERTDGDFARMAKTLLGDSDKARAVRLRFNQLGLKVRELRKS